MNEKEVADFIGLLCDTFSHGAPQTADARKQRALLFTPALADFDSADALDLVRAMSESKDTHYFPQLARLNEAIELVRNKPQTRAPDAQPCKVCQSHARGLVVLYVPTVHGIEAQHVSCQCPLGDDERALVDAVGRWYGNRDAHEQAIHDLPWRRQRRSAWGSDWPDRAQFNADYPEPGSLKWVAMSVYNSQLRLAAGLRIAYGTLTYYDIAPPIARWSALGMSNDGPGPLADRMLRCWSWVQLRTLLTPAEEIVASRAVELLNGYERRHEWTAASVAAAVARA